MFKLKQFCNSLQQQLHLNPIKNIAFKRKNDCVKTEDQIIAIKRNNFAIRRKLLWFKRKVPIVKSQSFAFKRKTYCD